MDYDESLRWLGTLPDFERTGEFAERPDVAPMVALLGELGEPHLGRATVHIAGSKGKGSTGAMIEAVLRPGGLRTGHYVSPHLHRYTERIRIDGDPISPDAFASALSSVRPAMEAVAARFPGRQFVAFDALTAAGFLTFRDANVAVQVTEVGLGGLLDSTNVFRMAVGGAAAKDRSEDLSVRVGREQGTGNVRRGAPHSGELAGGHVCVMTPISLEHTAVLGNTIGEIARQKAGIIVPGCVVVAAPQRESAMDVFREVAEERGARLVEVVKVCQMSRTSASGEGQEFRLKTSRGTYSARLPLAGRHQLDNAATAIVACEELVAGRSEVGGRKDSGEGEGVLSAATVSSGLAGVKWPGRLETIKTRPRVIVDGAHNGDSAKRMVAALREDFGLRSAVVLFGTLAGKDVAGMASAIGGFADAVFVTRWGSERAADPRESARVIAATMKDRSEDLSVQTYASLPEAYEAALAQAGERGAVVCFGSLAFVGAVRAWVLGIAGDG